MTEKIDVLIRRFLIPAENYIYGFTDLTGLLDKKFTGFNYGISIGKKLDSVIVDQIINGPTIEYYNHYKQANTDLAELAANISEELNRNEIETFNISPTVSTAELDSIYYKTLRTDLSHKMVATRAGLGWIGKTDLFISKKFGPRLRLVSILINVEVKSKYKPVDISRCGNCSLCVDKCPAKAANGKLWDITTEREDFFDAFKCRNQCAEFGKARLGIDARICGICVSVCPIGQGSTRF
jgi:epoxyqueuosine reductase